MARNAPSFTSNWVLYASLRHARKSRLFRGQRGNASAMEQNLASIAAPRSTFGRQLRLLKALRGKPKSANDLCRMLKVSRRTFFRDLATVRDAGIPVESDGDGFYLNGKPLRDVLGQEI